MPVTFTAHDPRTGSPIEPEFMEADAAAVDAALAGAVEAVPVLASLTLLERAALLDAVADALDADGEALIARADRESALGGPRLTGELARTTGQFRAFADVVREGAHLGVVIDHEDTTVKPRHPDLRRTMVPLGPVVVFGASNFPLAFGVAGGDTASALAAGCPVVAKAHPSNPGTSARIAEVITSVVARLTLPAGTFTVLQGAGHDVGASLVTHPDVAAVGFTGSLRGGRAIADLAAARPEPIPVYAEMGSHNPVWITPSALARRGTAIAQARGASATLGVGQFCTKPSVVFLPDDEATIAEEFVATLAATIGAAELGPMLDARILEHFTTRRDALTALHGVHDVTPEGDRRGVRPSVLVMDLATWRREPLVREECFGPLVVVVRVRATELLGTVASVPGGLTASVWSEPDDADDLRLAGALVTATTRRVGRVLHDGTPTGVSVSWAQQHGGPYPATNAATTTSVGMHAVDRFLRPVAYQDLPAALLPVWLHDENPWALPRRVDGRLELPPR
jgi:NADP-dependent aldehyde dehydrogenase